MPWSLIKKAFRRGSTADAPAPKVKSRPLCLGGKPKARNPPLPQRDFAAMNIGDAAEEFVFEKFERPARNPPPPPTTETLLEDELEVRAEHQRTLAYCPHCRTVVVPVEPRHAADVPLQQLEQQQQPQSRSGIRTNPWASIRMQKSLDSGICDELNRLSAAAAAADAAADQEVSAINGILSATVGRRSVLEGVARRGFVHAATWQAVAATATVAQCSGSSSSSSSPSPSASPSPLAPTDFDSPAASSSALSWCLLENIGGGGNEGQFSEQLDRCRRELMLRALASVRDQVEMEMARLMLMTPADSGSDFLGGQKTAGLRLTA